MVTGPGAAVFRGTPSSSVSFFGECHGRSVGLAPADYSEMLSTHKVFSPWTWIVSSRPTTRADASPGAMVHAPVPALTRRKRGPSQLSNPHLPRTTAVSSPAGSAGAGLERTRPPSPAAALTGSSTGPVLVSM